MSSVNKDLVFQCLKELSDRQLQDTLWMGTSPGQQSSFSEAVEGLFTDSGLGDQLGTGNSEFSPGAITGLQELERQVARVDGTGGPSKVINDPAMLGVRKLAASALEILKAESTWRSNSSLKIDD